MRYMNVQRMLTGGIIDPAYREQLVRDPFQAAADGFNGERFVLEPEEVDFFKENRGAPHAVLILKAYYCIFQEQAALLLGAPQRAPLLLE